MSGFLVRTDDRELRERPLGSSGFWFWRTRRRRKRKRVSVDTELDDVTDDGMDDTEETEADESSDSDDANDGERETAFGRRRECDAERRSSFFELGRGDDGYGAEIKGAKQRGTNIQDKARQTVSKIK